MKIVFGEKPGKGTAAGFVQGNGGMADWMGACCLPAPCMSGSLSTSRVHRWSYSIPERQISSYLCLAETSLLTGDLLQDLDILFEKAYAEVFTNSQFRPSWFPFKPERALPSGTTSK